NDVQANALAHPAEPDDGAGGARIHLRVARGPAGAFVAAGNLALEIDSPAIVVRIERERLEWNTHLGRPAVVGSLRARLPDALPVPVQARRVLEQRLAPPA